MLVETPRILRERRTIEVMILIYCREVHGSEDSLCTECEALRVYAMQRLERCVFGSEKPTCVKCPVHCYMQGRKDQVRQVMRYAGPKMLLHHPILAVYHLLDGKRKVQGLKRRPSRPD